MDRQSITAELVQRLIADQFPRFCELPVRPVALNGWDNVTFRLGEEYSVRLPSHDRYVAQIDKEHRWLHVLAPQLPLPIPEPVARGAPSTEFPRPWSVYRWLPGVPATPERVSDPVGLARELAEFLTALYGVDASGGPAAGPHSHRRGGPVAVWDEQVQHAIRVLGSEIPVEKANAVWRAAVDADSPGHPVWAHGDVVGSNLLVADGRLSAVIDFGCAAVGDPACDLPIAWWSFSGKSRATFRATVPVNEATWARGRGWALWKALVTLQEARRRGTDGSDASRRFGWRGSPREVLGRVLAEDP
jgi:aminoglycoside phosphotransferase (APT) family kinase protein